MLRRTQSLGSGIDNGNGRRGTQKREGARPLRSVHSLSRNAVREKSPVANCPEDFS